MVRITEKLIRKRSEHNELIIGTLEELSLHQEDIEKIEHIGNWCRDLKILLMQSNLVSRLENLNKLKKLEYLNLAINNIERIENLEALESLNKLDLTLNFIGELTTVETLRDNYNLRELFLTGNPCTDFEGYRDYVICALPQLESLDGQEISRTDRLKASRNFKINRARIVQLESQYQITRDEQKVRVAETIQQQEESTKDLTEDERSTQFWQQKSEHCPEMRVLMSQYSKRGKDRSNVSLDDATRVPKRDPVLFAPCGRPYSLNAAKLKFNFVDEDDRYELTLHVYKFLDTSLIEVDAQPSYIRVTVRGKIFQLALKEEIQLDASTCQRSSITGHMLIVMPKLNPANVKFDKNNGDGKFEAYKDIPKNDKQKELNGTVDYRNIVNQKTDKASPPIDEDEIPDLI
ncbi:protein tilB-like [Uranotaenia lowii]|uniref:protein tilB-like n=1 Tax=Uranotaenia lowii TaxID=190385 RepID=UPI00247A56FF|nr:protein tilB-like [Uranotaenia lowii]